ncbi:Protein FAM83H [Mizuhopecten yessoensis]|uniref:Protein FAM83H n=1 Tax=Mizuhopecten yessoensis TaxID=6573 RepID=A0A210PRV9_MIZYE|nr:Protein FAM83H [Mizuhopecten yessoensis]
MKLARCVSSCPTGRTQWSEIERQMANITNSARWHSLSSKGSAVVDDEYLLVIRLIDFLSAISSPTEALHLTTPTRGQPNTNTTPTRGQPNSNTTPTRGQPNTNTTPTRGQSNTYKTPTRGKPNTNTTPTRRQPNTNTTPTRGQPNSNTTPTRGQSNTNKTPTRGKPNTNTTPTRGQPNTNITPFTQHTKPKQTDTFTLRTLFLTKHVKTNIH